MRAVRLHAVGEPLRVEEVPMPEPAGTEVRVRVAGCGVCHTDLHVVDGIQTRVELPVTLGHEVAGWIDAIGPDRRRVRHAGRRCRGRARRLGLRRVPRVPRRRGAALRSVGGARLPGGRWLRRGHARAPSAPPRAAADARPGAGRAAGRRRHHALPRRPPRRALAGAGWPGAADRVRRRSASSRSSTCAWCRMPAAT